MPRPTSRRRLALVVLVLISVTFVTLDYRMRDGSAFSGLRSVAGAVIEPMQRAVSRALSPVHRLIGDDESGSQRERQLRRDSEALRRQLGSATLDRAGIAQLRGLNLLAGAGGYRIVPGRVIALGPSADLEWTATIDLGTRDGVRQGMTVINGDGLVGRVKRAADHSSVVLLTIDPLSAAGARLEGSGQLGLCSGEGLHPLRLQLLDPNARVSVGDRLVTGPYGQTTYAAGLPIGTVSKVTPSSSALVRIAQVRPFVRFTALDIIGVVLVAARTDPRDSVLPPKPAKSK